MDLPPVPLWLVKSPPVGGGWHSPSRAHTLRRAPEATASLQAAEAMRREAQERPEPSGACGGALEQHGRALRPAAPPWHMNCGMTRWKLEFL